MSQSPGIGQNSDGGISDFQISSISLINGNSRSSDDYDMKLGSVTKLDKRNKAASKKLTIIFSENCYVIAIFSIYWEFGAT